MSDIQEEPTQKMSPEEWLATRVEAGIHIDPDTAGVDWEYGDPGDPDRVYPDRPAECRCIGRVRFARAPGTDIWISRKYAKRSLQAPVGKHKRRPRRLL